MTKGKHRLLTRSAILLSVISALACGRVTNPSAYHFETAKEYAEAGQFDEALSTLDSIEKDHPSSTEAKEVPYEKIRVLILKSKAAYDRNDFVDGGKSIMSAVALDPSDDKVTFQRWITETDPVLNALFIFAVFTSTSPDSDTLGYSTTILDDGSVSAGLKEATQKWTCDHYSELPEFAACQGYTPDTSGSWAARNTYADLVVSCESLQRVTAACGSTVTTTINAAVTKLTEAKTTVDPRSDFMPCQIHELHKDKLDLAKLWDFKYGANGLPSASRSTNGWTVEQERKSGRTDDEIYAWIDDPYEATYEYDSKGRLSHYRQLASSMDTDNEGNITSEYWFSYGSDGKVSKVRDRGGEQYLVFDDKGLLFANQEHINLGSIQTTGVTLRGYKDNEYPLFGLPMVFAKNVIYGEYKALFTMGELSDASYLWEIEYEGKRIKLIRTESSIYRFHYDCYADK